MKRFIAAVAALVAALAAAPLCAESWARSNASNLDTRTMSATPVATPALDSRTHTASEASGLNLNSTARRGTVLIVH